MDCFICGEIINSYPCAWFDIDKEFLKAHIRCSKEYKDETNGIENGICISEDKSYYCLDCLYCNKDVKELEAFIRFSRTGIKSIAHIKCVQDRFADFKIHSSGNAFHYTHGFFFFPRKNLLPKLGYIKANDHNELSIKYKEAKQENVKFNYRNGEVDDLKYYFI